MRGASVTPRSAFAGRDAPPTTVRQRGYRLSGERSVWAERLAPRRAQAGKVRHRRCQCDPRPQVRGDRFDWRKSQKVVASDLDGSADRVDLLAVGGTFRRGLRAEPAWAEVLVPVRVSDGGDRATGVGGQAQGPHRHSEDGHDAPSPPPRGAGLRSGCFRECRAAGYNTIEMREIALPVGEVPEGVLPPEELEAAGKIKAPFVLAEACVGCGLCE